MRSVVPEASGVLQQGWLWMGRNGEPRITHGDSIRACPFGAWTPLRSIGACLRLSLERHTVLSDDPVAGQHCAKHSNSGWRFVDFKHRKTTCCTHPAERIRKLDVNVSGHASKDDTNRI
jgi:hypothetical protein